MRTIATILLGAGLWGAEPTAKPPATLTKEERLTLENLSLRAALLKTQEKEIETNQQAVVTAICARAGVPATACQIDPQTGAITARAEVKK